MMMLVLIMKLIPFLSPKMANQSKIEINKLKKELVEKNSTIELSKHKLAATERRLKELENQNKVLQLDVCDF